MGAILIQTTTPHKQGNPQCHSRNPHESEEESQPHKGALTSTHMPQYNNNKYMFLKGI